VYKSRRDTMNRGRIYLAVIAVIGIFFVLYGFGTKESNAGQQGGLSILIESEGEFTELEVSLTEEDLYAYFDEALVAMMLEGEPLHLVTPEALAGVLELVELPVGITADNIIVLYGVEVPATWTCIKCCYAAPPLACCCKVKDEAGDE
jgi:hypothetical protein